ncbi:toxin-antitoxin system HicB family antitoxin [Rubritalea profundi]|uniref:toxin-antitoxin system HicB family antitoxin n=1 Tax=Rubritalea profundi TaxID=1658618 RepID=UPI00198211EB
MASSRDLPRRGGWIEGYDHFSRRSVEEPDKPYSGKFLLRVEPTLHRRLSA